MGSPSKDGQGPLDGQGGRSGEHDPRIASTIWRCPLAQGGNGEDRQAAAFSDTGSFEGDRTSDISSGGSQPGKSQRGSSNSSYGVEMFMVNHSGKITQHLIFVQFAEAADIDPVEMVTVNTEPAAYIGADIERILPPSTMYATGGANARDLGAVSGPSSTSSGNVAAAGGGGDTVNPAPVPARGRRKNAAFAEALALEIDTREKIKKVRLGVGF